MHIINGGIYNEKEYSCMFDARERYENPTSSGLHYAQWGIDEETDGQAILFFRTINNSLAYAESIKDLGPFKTVLEEREAIAKAAKDITSRNAFLSKQGVLSELNQIEAEDISYYAESHEDEHDINKVTSHIFKISINPSLADLMGLYPDWNKEKTIFDRPAIYLEVTPTGETKNFLICTGPERLESLSKHVFPEFVEMLDKRVNEVLEEFCERKTEELSQGQIPTSPLKRNPKITL